MSKHQFIEKKFSRTSMYIIDLATQILEDFRKMGYRLSLRQLYYQMVSKDALPQSWADKATGSTNNQASYKKVGDIISDARLAGMLDWAMIEDRGRDAYLPPAWENPADIVAQAARQFRINRWEGQECYVEVMVEKDALSGVLQSVCSDLHVRLTANKGYSSSTAMYDAGRRIKTALSESDGTANEAHIFYLGDHDPSGIDMTRDVTDRLLQFAELDYDTIVIHRIALNINQVREWNPPENPAKQTDSRYSKYVEEFGESSWELDAVHPQTLAGLLRDSIKSLIDESQWDEIADKERDMRNELVEYAESYGKKKGKK